MLVSFQNIYLSIWSDLSDLSVCLSVCLSVYLSSDLQHFHNLSTSKKKKQDKNSCQANTESFDKICFSA